MELSIEHLDTFSIREEMGIPDKKLKFFTPEEAREYNRIKLRRMYARDPEKAREKSRQYRSKNRELVNAAARKYRRGHSEAHKAAAKRHRESHKEEIAAKMQAWREKNREHLKQYSLEYRNRPGIKKYRYSQENLRQKKLRASNPAFRALANQRVRLCELAKSKGVQTSKTLGFSSTELRESMERKFKSGMTWENYGSGWVCDHIIPCAQFDLTKPSELRACFSLQNLQPLWKDENRKKWHRLPEQMDLPL